MVNFLSSTDYRNAYKARGYVSRSPTSDTLEVLRIVIPAFRVEMYDIFSYDINNTGKALWIDFISTLQQNPLGICPKVLTYELCQLVQEREVYSDSDVWISRGNILTGLLSRKTRIRTSLEDADNKLVFDT